MTFISANYESHQAKPMAEEIQIVYCGQSNIWDKCTALEVLMVIPCKDELVFVVRLNPLPDETPCYKVERFQP